MSKISKSDLYLLISEALEISIENVNDDLGIGKIDEWDSLGQLAILSALDKKLDGQASKLRELADISTVNDIIEILIKEALIKE
tara:strand:- start:545 stop:796 length:252 start_codon:yes stop_codon:yes gene_type:complete